MSGIAPDRDQAAGAAPAAPAAPTGKPAWWKRIAQLYQRRPLLYGFFTLLGLTLLVAGLSPLFSSGDRLGPTRRPPETPATRLRAIADSLRRMDEFGQMPYAELLRDTLNPWMRQLKPPGAWEPDPYIFEISPQFQLAEQNRQRLTAELAELQQKLSGKGPADGKGAANGKTPSVGKAPAPSKSPPSQEDRAKLASLVNQLQMLEQTKKQNRSMLIEELSTLNFSLNDAFTIEATAWMRDVSNRVRDRLAERSRGAVDSLALAQELFDWTVRNVALDEKEVGVELLWESLAWGRGPSSTRAWIFIELCRQQGLDAVMLGYRDAKDPGNRTQSKYKFWVPAVLLSQGAAEADLYLFEHTWGVPIPGPGGRGVATLAQAAASPEVLAQLDAVDRYPVHASDLKEVVAMLDVSAHLVSRRMQVLEGELTGADRLVLTVDLRSQAERLQKTKGVTRVEAWPWPTDCEVLAARTSQHVRDSRRALFSMEGVEEKGQKNDALRKDPQFNDLMGARQLDPAAADPASTFELAKRAKRQQQVSGFLWRGRMLQFHGVFADTDHQSTGPDGQAAPNARQPSAAEGAKKGAPNVYQSGRLSDQDLDELKKAIEADLKTLTAKRNEALTQGATDADLKGVDQHITLLSIQLQRIPLMRFDRQFARLIATFWVGQVAFERGDYADAAAYFRNALNVEAKSLSAALTQLPAKPGSEIEKRLRQYADEVIRPMLTVVEAGANYNLARALEASGQYPEAIQAYNNDSTLDQRPGSLLRARRLEARLAADPTKQAKKKSGETKKPDAKPDGKKTEGKQPDPKKPAAKPEAAGSTNAKQAS